VLDDNKKLCLNSGEIVQMSAQMNMVFEVGDLAAASPATVSRCGMVYLDDSQIGWRPLTLSWLATLPAHVPEGVKAHLLGLFDWLVPVCLRFVRREVKEASPTLPGMLVAGLHRVWSAAAARLLDAATGEKLMATGAVEAHAEGVFLFALAWSVGASAATVEGRAAFDRLLRAAVAGKLHGAPPHLRYWLCSCTAPNIGVHVLEVGLCATA
jgi:dynein heavy chain, axonemal